MTDFGYLSPGKLNPDLERREYIKQRTLIHEHEAYKAKKRLDIGTSNTDRTVRTRQDRFLWLGLLDPIKRFPYEVSTLVIFESISSRRTQTLRVLELTMVSQVWRRFLLDTPQLWCELFIDETQEDLIATLATSIRFSHHSSLRLFLCDRPVIDWNSLKAVIIPIFQRITILTIVELQGEIREDRNNSIYTLSEALTHLGHPPRLRDLEFESEDSFDFQLPQIEPIGLFPTVRIFGNIISNSLRFGVETPWSRASFGAERYNISSSFESPIDLKGMLSLKLRFPTGFERPAPQNQAIATIHVQSETLQNIRIFMWNFDQCRSFEHLAIYIFPYLQQFTTTVPRRQVPELLECLHLLVHLKVLGLTLMMSETQDTAATLVQADKKIYGLREFTISVIPASNNHSDLPFVQNKHLDPLFAQFKLLYPGVESCHLKLVDPPVTPFFPHSYFESLKWLNTLFIESESGMTNLNNPIKLLLLRSLRVGHPSWLGCIEAPFLLSLHVSGITSGAEMASLTLGRDLRKLVLCSKMLCTGDYIFNPNLTIKLAELEIISLGALKRVEFSVFSHLSTIKLVSHHFMNPEGNRICTMLIYYPEACPSLQAIHFNNCLEWDILFIMLEMRNIRTRGIKRILTISLPYIPVTLCGPLELLLAGERSDLPSWVSLSLEETREELWDPAV